MAKYVVEVCNKYNDNWLFPANGGELLRGRWDYMRVANLDVGSKHKTLSQALSPHGSAIPGLYIEIDTSERTVSIYDPLAETKKGRDIWNSIKLSLDQFGGNMVPREKSTTKLPEGEKGDNTLKSWAYWVSRGVSDGDCLPVVSESEPIPSPEEIEDLWDGERLKDPYDTTTPRVQKPRKPQFQGAKKV
jgi:hypothetical protein